MTWFKNMHIKPKLILSFAVVIVFAVIMAIVSIISVSNLDVSYSYLLEYPQVRLQAMMQVDTECSVLRRLSATIVANTSNQERVNDYWKQFTTSYDTAVAKLNEYIASNDKDTVRDAETLQRNNGIAREVLQYLSSYKAAAEKGKNIALETGDAEAANNEFYAVSSLITDANASVLILKESALKLTDEISVENTAQKNTSIYTLVAIIAVIIVLSMVIAIYVARLISKPMTVLTNFMQKAGSTGDTTLRPEDIAIINEVAQIKDELGVCISSTASFIGRVNEISDKLGQVASGDLTVDIKLLSQNDVMGSSLNTMMDNLNNMFGELKLASNQVSAGAGQVSQAAQSLASGSSEQAASIQEFTATLAEMQNKTAMNADSSTKAREANSKAGARLSDSISSMGEMLEAMRAIDESSASITKVIKVIDDIAFQTNILALNAAVEAARAGQHGKGFAVVADEVRNLASKSAAAAKETATLIEGSSERVRQGNQIVAKTNNDLEAAALDSEESTRLIELVAASSNEQAQAIKEINSGIEQISTVVQANSATAQQSAAAAQQMSAQSVVMNEIVDRFKLKNTDAYGYQAPMHKLGPSRSESFAGSGDRFGGKY